MQLAPAKLLFAAQEVATASALEWAKLCGEWAFGAAKAEHMFNASCEIWQDVPGRTTGRCGGSLAAKVAAGRRRVR